MTSTARMEPSPWRVGALRILAPRSATAPEQSYVNATKAFCPFLTPSVERGLTSWTVYGIVPGAGPEEIEAAVFEAAVESAERVRKSSRGPSGHLVCENLVVEGASRGELDWPHWALKNLYVGVGLMFGKFWTGETGASRSGVPLPVPSFTFLSVRPAVRRRDPYFLDDTPALAEVIRDAEDDGRDVFAGLSRDWKEIKKWSSTLPRPARP
ncbi:hypothetical protein [Streptomyces sp. NPDC059708]|uniref:hypothetical protein n=1 Tax=Streptomyces sp. NPDC059708 TaxID=3346916 RepID=UPI00369D3C0B